MDLGIATTPDGEGQEPRGNDQELQQPQDGKHEVEYHLRTFLLSLVLFLWVRANSKHKENNPHKNRQ